jgi:hypothetical protein
LRVAPNLLVGDYGDYLNWTGPFVLSATKRVHVEALGYAPSPGDPRYLQWSSPTHLTLNLVDGPAHLYSWGGVPLFREALDFIETRTPSGNLLVHCDEGMSRAPTLALLYLAKRARTIPGASFEAANAAFRRIYPNYWPGGIADYVEDNWASIR